MHLINGKKYFVFTDCFNKIDKSVEFYRKYLFKGRQNHKKECFFWDSKNKGCKNEKIFKNLKK